MAPEAVEIMAMQHRCVAKWERARKSGGPYAGIVSIGTLPDGRWYVWVIGRWADNRARLYPTEAEARGVAERWQQRIGGAWEQIPCNPNTGWRPGEQEG